VQISVTTALHPVAMMTTVVATSIITTMIAAVTKG